MPVSYPPLRPLAFFVGLTALVIGAAVTAGWAIEKSRVGREAARSLLRDRLRIAVIAIGGSCVLAIGLWTLAAPDFEAGTVGLALLGVLVGIVVATTVRDRRRLGPALVRLPSSWRPWARPRESSRSPRPISVPKDACSGRQVHRTVSIATYG